MQKKVNYNTFCENLGVYIMNEFKSGENNVDAKSRYYHRFSNKNKSAELTDDEKTYLIDIDIKKEEVKNYIKYLKLIKLNLNEYIVWYYRNSTDSVKPILNANKDFEAKLKSFEHS